MINIDIVRTERKSVVCKAVLSIYREQVYIALWVCELLKGTIAKYSVYIAPYDYYLCHLQ